MKSGVLLVHNEEKYLPYSLYSLMAASLDELIVVLDRCTDLSEKIIRMFQPEYPVKIYYKTKLEWINPIAEATEYGIERTTGNFIYVLASDIFYDLRIFNESFFQNYDMLSFRIINRDLNTSLIRSCYENIMAKVFQRIGIQNFWRGGPIAFKRVVWEKLHIKDCNSEYGEHNQFVNFKDRLEKLGFRYSHVESARNLDLRNPSLLMKSQMLQGKARALLGFSLWKVVLHSFLHLKPHVLIGYLQETRRTP